jgi:uncharacterized protein (TIGR02147 family)
MDKPDIYAYGDYRKFIRDFYRSRKAAGKKFSLQRFAELAGFKTKTFLHKVMNGEKALSSKSILNVAKAMELKQRETEYFEALVHFNEGTTVEEREYYFRRLQSFKYYSGQVRIRANQFAFFSKWYHVVVRELIEILGFDGDFRRLARSVVPHIRPDQAKRSVDLLLRLGLIEKTGGGRYRQRAADITTGDEVLSVAVQRFQKDTMGLAADAIDRFGLDEREIATLTMGLSARGFETVKKELQTHRKHLVELARNDASAERVYQLNVQLFPVSQHRHTGGIGS